MLGKIVGLFVLIFCSSALAEIPFIPEPPEVSVAAIFNNSLKSSMTVHYSICANEPSNDQIKNTDVCPKVYTKNIPKRTATQTNYATVFIPNNKLDTDGKVLVYYKLKILEVEINNKIIRSIPDIINNPCSTDLAHGLNAIALNDSIDKKNNHAIICRATQFKLLLQALL